MNQRDDGRRRHYGGFYGLEDEALASDGRPVLVVHGNCQAEALRVLFELRYPQLRAVRMVPAHELVAHDVPHLRRLLARAKYLVTQPIADDYRSLPIGTRQLLSQAAHLRVAHVPVLFWSGLHPTQVTFNSIGIDPPIVPYHDLRTVAEAAGLPRPHITVEYSRWVRERSGAQLRQRIEAAGAVDVLDPVTAPGQITMQVINHPSNAVLQATVSAAAAQLGLPATDPVDPGRMLLRSVIAGVEDVPAQLAGVNPTGTDWHVGDTRVSNEQVIAAHRAFYRHNPAVLRGLVRRYAEELTMLTRAVKERP